MPLARELQISQTEIDEIEKVCANNIPKQADIMLRLWADNGTNVSGNALEKGLRAINRDDIVTACIFNVEPVSDAVEKEIAKQHLDGGGLDQSGYDSLKMDQSGFESLKEELGGSRDSSLRRNEKIDPDYGDKNIMKVNKYCRLSLCISSNIP